MVGVPLVDAEAATGIHRQGCEPEEDDVEYRVEERGEFTIVGRELRVSLSDAKKEIPRFWERCGAEGMFKVFDAMPGRVGESALGWAGDLDPQSKMFSYICCVEVSRIGEIPRGMVSRSLPASRYFVATAKGKMPQAVQKVIGDKEQWMKDAGFERSARYDFELYDKDYDQNDPESEVTIWSPIQ